MQNRSMLWRVSACIVLITMLAAFNGTSAPTVAAPPDPTADLDIPTLLEKAGLSPELLLPASHNSVVNGAYQWHTFWGGTGLDFAYDIAIDPDDGSLYLSGNSGASWNGPQGQSPLHAYSGNNDVFVVKLSASGTYQWHTFYGSSSDDQGIALSLDPLDTSIYLAGYSEASWNGPAGQTPINTFSGSGYNGLVLKLSASGAYQWHTFYGGTSGQTITSDIVLDPNASGLVYISARSNSNWDAPGSIGPLTINADTYGALILALGRDGTYQWHRFYVGSRNSYASGLAYDSSGGNLYVTGYSESSWTGPSAESPLNAYNDNSDVFVLKLSSSGAYKWHTFYGGYDYDDSDALALDNNGNVYIVGSSWASWNGPAGQSPRNAYSADSEAMVLKLSSTGTYRWHTFLGGSSADALSDIIVQSGELKIIGLSSKSWDGPSGQAPLHAHNGNYDITVVELNTTGAYQWHSFLGSSNTDYGNALAIDDAGNIYAAAHSYGAWDGPAGQSPLHAYTSGYDAVVLKLGWANAETPLKTLFLPLVMNK